MYIAFEGIDGSGKTTQIDLLKKYNIPNTSFIKEPYYFNSHIKELLLHTNYGNPLTHNLLFLSTHSELYYEYLIHHNIRNFISDRSLYSTLAYSHGSKPSLSNNLETVLDTLKIALYPDVVIYLENTIENMEKNIGTRKINKNVIEKQSSDYFKQVLLKYKQLSRDSPSKWYMLDATDSIELIHTQVIAILEKEMKYGFSKLDSNSSIN